MRPMTHLMPREDNNNTLKDQRTIQQTEQYKHLKPWACDVTINKYEFKKRKSFFSLEFDTWTVYFKQRCPKRIQSFVPIYQYCAVYHTPLPGEENAFIIKHNLAAIKRHYC